MSQEYLSLSLRRVCISIRLWFAELEVGFSVYEGALPEGADEVVGGRMPQMADLEHLPYIKALIKEIFRLRPALSLGLPHAMEEDATYKGYVIPKGSVVLLNSCKFAVISEH